MTATVQAREIVSRCNTALHVKVPSDFFDTLPNNVRVFESLYRWLSKRQGVNVARLHCLTYVGNRLQRQLMKAERKRIARVHHLSGEALDQAVGWSNMDSGPMELFAGRPIAGDGLILFPDEAAREAARSIESEMSREAHEAEVKRVRSLASGRNFAEWLASNVGRQDPVGDLAVDCQDSSIPTDTDEHFALRRSLERLGACHEVLEALGDAWIEYAAKYPDRIRPMPRCAGCLNEHFWQNGLETVAGYESTLINNISDGVLAWSKCDDEAFIYHAKCCDKEAQSDYELEVMPLDDVERPGAVDAFIARLGIRDYDGDSLKRILALTGFAQSAKTSVVYFIRSADSGLIKIGLTRCGVERRLASLKTGHPGELVVLATMPGDRAVERNLHERFASLRRSGEWFAAGGALMGFIASVKGS